MYSSLWVDCKFIASLLRAEQHISPKPYLRVAHPVKLTFQMPTLLIESSAERIETHREEVVKNLSILQSALLRLHLIYLHDKFKCIHTVLAHFIMWRRLITQVLRRQMKSCVELILPWLAHLGSNLISSSLRLNSRHPWKSKILSVTLYVINTT